MEAIFKEVLLYADMVYVFLDGNNRPEKLLLPLKAWYAHQTIRLEKVGVPKDQQGNYQYERIAKRVLLFLNLQRW